MKKVEITVQENIQYENIMVVLQPEEMSDQEFKQVLKKAEIRNRSFHGGSGELASILNQMGMEVNYRTYNFPNSPQSAELEVTDMRVMLSN